MYCALAGQQDKMYDLGFKVTPNDGSGKRSSQDLLQLYKEYISK
jgi:hypothetical protein